MAIASRTIDRFAEVTLIPKVTIGRVARALREADSSLFPRDPIGRNKSTENTPPHYVNLLIGVGVADPITAAPQLVRAYRQASFTPPLEEILEETPSRLPILAGQSLGLDLESLIDLLARPSPKERRVRQAFDGDFRVTLVVGDALVATVERPSLGQVDQYDAKPFTALAEREQRRPEVAINGRTLPLVPLRRIVQLDFSHFEVAAELWADSLKRGATYQPSLLDPSDGDPDENAALPGAASSRDQDHKPTPGTSNIPKGKRERKKPQASSICGSGHPVHSNRVTSHVRSSRQHSFELLSSP